MEDFTQAIKADWQITLPFIAIYVATTFVDIFFGMAVAFTGKRLCSTIGRKGIMRKLLMGSTVLLAVLFDGILPAIDITIFGLNLHLTFGALACVWWLIHELLSITEHAAILGMPMPKRLRESLAIVREAFDRVDDEGAEQPAAALENDQGQV